MNGIILVDKPQGMTSHDVVDKMRKAAKMRRIGHTGTLDPRATGLLILCLGQATRLSQHFSGLGKSYKGAMRLGLVTASHDLDGETLAESPLPDGLGLEAIQEACNAFVGNIEQVPPMVSAIKIGGKRLYKIAREGGEVERPPRSVVVDAFNVTAWDSPEASIFVRCSSGVYVRTLCHDVGARLGCGAALARLRRTHVGAYSVENALPLEAFDGVETVMQRLLPMDAALDLPEVRVNKVSEAVIRSGGVISSKALETPCPVSAGMVQIKNEAGKLIALGAVAATAAGARIQPKCVFAQS